MRSWHIARVLVGVAVVLIFVAATLMMSPRESMVEARAENLMMVLRESADTDRDAGLLVPTGRVQAMLRGGEAVEVELAWFRLLGDMDVRFIFVDGQRVRYAMSEDLARLSLTAEQALALAVANLKRLYGRPSVQPFAGGLQQVKGAPAYLSGGYLFDLPFWNALLRQNPDGVAAALPKRGGPIFAPLSNSSAVGNLREAVAAVHRNSEALRVSSAMYLYKDQRWSVIQGPQ